MTIIDTSSTSFAEAARRIPELPSTALESALVPGDSGLPVVGHTLSFLRHTQAFMTSQRERYGADFRVRIFGQSTMVLGSPAAVREVLLDKDKNFSSDRGWRNIGELFRGGLMLRDFEEHRVDRRIMQAAFRPDAMRGYVTVMNAQIPETVRAWPSKLRLYPALKRLTLDMASRIFLGLALGRDSRTVDRAFIATVAASLALVRRDWPLLSYGRGMRGRRVLERFFSELIRERRANPGSDLLSELCRAKSEEGERFSDAAIRDHMIFLMMAAHDTTTSSLSSIVHLLLAHPEWQERVRDEIRARGAGPLSWDDRTQLPLLDRCLDEALRLLPPAPFIARRSIRACSIAGFEIPANTGLGVSSLVTHRLPEYWSAPDDFDPDRFLPERAEHNAHSHLYYPFGGGAHVCIGLHFARIQVKAVLNEVLANYRIRTLQPAAKRKLVAVPIPYPRDGLPIILDRIR